MGRGPSHRADLPAGAARRSGPVATSTAQRLSAGSDFDIRRHLSGLGAQLAGPANVIMQLSWPGVGYGVQESRVDSGNALKHPVKRARTTFTYLAVALLGTAEDQRIFPQGGQPPARPGALERDQSRLLQRPGSPPSDVGRRLPVLRDGGPDGEDARAPRRLHGGPALRLQLPPKDITPGQAGHVAARPGGVLPLLGAVARRGAHPRDHPPPPSQPRPPRAPPRRGPPGCG